MTLNLFKDIMPAATTRNYKFYAEQDQEGRKEIEKSFWMLQRLMSQIPKHNSYYIQMLNELVNHEWSSLTKHPELRWMLFAMSGSGSKDYYQKKFATGNPKIGRRLDRFGELAIQVYPEANDKEIDYLRQHMEVNDLEQMLGKGNA